MENTSLIGLSRQVALRRELEVIANNVANMNTTGFKGDDIIFNEYVSDAAREDTFRPGNDRKISFVWDRATWYNTTQGELSATGNPLDVALNGTGMFVIDAEKGERYTRNGAFQINAQGRLVNNQGRDVMGLAGPIVFQPTDTNIMISRDGTVSTSNGNRGRLRIVDVENQRDFIKDGENLFRVDDGRAVQPATRPSVYQGFVEKSNVKAVQQISRMIEVTRAYADLASMLERLDQKSKDTLKELSGVNS